MNRQKLKELSDTTFFDNEEGGISPNEHRAFNNAVINSMTQTATFYIDSQETFDDWRSNKAGNDYTTVLLATGTYKVLNETLNIPVATKEVIGCINSIISCVWDAPDTYGTAIQHQVRRFEGVFFSIHVTGQDTVNSADHTHRGFPATQRALPATPGPAFFRCAFSYVFSRKSAAGGGELPKGCLFGNSADEYEQFRGPISFDGCRFTFDTSAFSGEAPESAAQRFGLFVIATKNAVRVVNSEITLEGNGCIRITHQGDSDLFESSLVLQNLFVKGALSIETDLKWVDIGGLMCVGVFPLTVFNLTGAGYTMGHIHDVSLISPYSNPAVSGPVAFAQDVPGVRFTGVRCGGAWLTTHPKAGFRFCHGVTHCAAPGFYGSHPGSYTTGEITKCEDSLEGGWNVTRAFD